MTSKSHEKSSQNHPSNKLTKEEEEEILLMGGTNQDFSLVEVSDEEVIEGKEMKGIDELQGELRKMIELSGMRGNVSEESEESDDESNDDTTSNNNESDNIESEEISGEKSKLTVPTKSPLPTKLTKLLQFPTDWYSVDFPTNFPFPATFPTNLLPPTIKQQLNNSIHSIALNYYNNQVELFSPSLSKGDADFVNHVLKAGTSSDKISALQLLFQANPLLQWNKFHQGLFKDFACKPSKREALLGVDVIVDLLLGKSGSSPLLPDRKLIYFIDQPAIQSVINSSISTIVTKLGIPLKKNDSLSPLWKNLSDSLLSHIVSDTLATSGITPMQLILYHFEDTLKKWYFEFIKILESLSKDTLIHVKKKSMHHILSLLSSKPEQEQNLLTLLTNKLGDGDKAIPSLTTHLLHKLLQQHPVMKSVVIDEVERMIWRPHVGTRAQYYSVIFLNQIILNKNDEDVANKLVMIYFKLFERLVSISTPSTTPSTTSKAKPPKKQRWKDRGNKQAMTKDVDSAIAKLMGSLLTGINRAIPFSNLSQELYNQHLNSLFKISHVGNYTTAIQALFVIFTVTNARASIPDRYYKTLYEFLLNPNIPIIESKQAQILNLVYRSLKSDPNLIRVVAILKRLLQISIMATSSFGVACLYLLGEIIKIKNGIVGLFDVIDEDEDLEHFKDVDSDDSDGGNVGEKILDEQSNTYDPWKRDPLYSNSIKISLWEILPFLTHFHPTIRLYSSQLLHEHFIKVPKDNYDPLKNHTLSRFLDRFMYKNPKSHITSHSIHAPKDGKEGDEDRGVLFHGFGKLEEDLPVNKIQQGPDEEFFKIYFDNRVVKEKKAEGGDEEGEEFDDEEVWKAMMKSSGFGDEDVDIDDEDDNSDLDEDVDEDVGSDVDVDEESDEESDGEMERLLGNANSDSSQDEQSSQQSSQESDNQSEDEEDEQEDTTSKTPSRKTRGLAKTAQKLGYKGSYFSTNDDFASAEDFMDLIEGNDEEGDEEGESDEDDWKALAQGEQEEGNVVKAGVKRRRMMKDLKAKRRR